MISRMGRSRAKSMIHLPASFSRRRPRFGRDSRGNPSSGAEMAPERGLRTPRPRERALRREAPQREDPGRYAFVPRTCIDLRGSHVRARTCIGGGSGWGRKARCESLRSPRVPLRPRKRALRREIDAGGLPLDVIAATTRLPARNRRRRVPLGSAR